MVNLNISSIAQEVIKIYLISLCHLDINLIGGLLTLSQLSGRCAHRIKITILENLDLTDMSNAKYRSFNIFNNVINIAQYSEKLIASENSLTLENYTQYENDIIENFNSQKIIKIDLINLISDSSLVKILSVKSNPLLNVKLINLITFFIFFLSFIFLIFFNSQYIGSKQSLRNPILISLSMLIYSFIIFNNSLVTYKQEFELLASLIVLMLFL